MNPNIKRHLAILFLAILIPLTGVMVLAVWDILDKDTINKSLGTLAIISVFLTFAIITLSFVDIEHGKIIKPKPKKKTYKANSFHKDE